MQSGSERAGAGSEAEAKIGVTMKAEAEVAAGANQAAGEAQRASGQPEQEGGPSRSLQGWGSLRLRLPACHRARCAGVGLGSTSQVIRKAGDSLAEAGDRGPPRMRVVRFQHQVEDSTTGIPEARNPLLPWPLCLI